MAQPAQDLATGGLGVDNPAKIVGAGETVDAGFAGGRVDFDNLDDIAAIRKGGVTAGEILAGDTAGGRPGRYWSAGISGQRVAISARLMRRSVPDHGEIAAGVFEVLRRRLQ